MLLAGPLSAEVTQPAAGLLRTLSTGADGEQVMLWPPVVSPDGSRIAITVTAREGPGGGVSVCDIATGDRLFTRATTADAMLVVIRAFSPDGRRAALVTQDRRLGNTLDVIDLASGDAIYTHKMRLGYMNVFFTPDGQRLLHNQQRTPDDPDPGMLRLAVVDLASAKVVGEFATGQWDRPTGLFSPDGTAVLTVDSNTSGIRLWNLATSAIICSLEMADNDHQSSLVFVESGRIIRGANRAGVIQSWDAATGRRLTRVEPPDLLMDEGSMRFADDGQALLIARSGSIEWRDATTARAIGIWPHGPKSRSTADLATLHHDTVAVRIDGGRSGDVAVLRLPPIRDLAPAGSARPDAQQVRTQEAPPTPPAQVPPHTERDRRSAIWWLDRAEAEWNSVAAEPARQQLLAALIAGRAEAGDEPGMQRLAAAADALYPRPRNVDWFPMDEVRFRVVCQRARGLVRNGKAAEAIGAVRAAARSAVQLADALSDIAAEQARAGDINGCVATIALIDSSAAGRAWQRAVGALLAGGRLAEAERMAQRIPDDHWRSRTFAHVAVVRARNGEVDDAIAALEKSLGGHRQVIAALAEHKDDAAARRVIASLPPHMQNDARAWLARAQFDRDDVAASSATASEVTGTPAYELRASLAAARVRLGLTQEAIAAVFENALDHRLAVVTFDELLIRGRLDAAAEMLGRVRQVDADRDTTAWRRKWGMRLARAFAETDRIDDAEKTLASTALLARQDGEAAQLHRGATWAIAAAKRRAGDAAGLAAVRGPLLNAVLTAPGAPSLAGAQAELLAFAVTTGDVDAAEALLWRMDPRLRAAVVMQLFIELSDAANAEAATTWVLSRQRTVTRLAMLLRAPSLAGAITNRAAREHVVRDRISEWLEWSGSLPTVGARAQACVGMAQALLFREPQATD